MNIPSKLIVCPAQIRPHDVPLSKRFKYFLFPFVVLALAACGPATTPVKNTPPPPKPTAAAEAHLAAQNYLAAAEEFWRLSAQNAEAGASERYAMRAALAYVDAGEYDQAAAIISDTAVTDTVAIRIANLASAAIGEKSPQYVYSPNEIATKLSALEARHLTPYQKGIYYRTLGRANYNLGEFKLATVQLNQALNYVQAETEKPAIHQLLWQAVGQLDSEQRADLIQAGDRNLIAWLALRDSTDDVIHDAPGLSNAISHWRSQFPSHPGNQYIVEQLFEISESLSRKATHIALLLPFDSRYKRAAEAIRNGFLSAWYADTGITKPEVTVYSVTAETVAKLYQTATANGADFIVGPLEKQTIQTLLSTVSISTPILLLNRIDQASFEQIAANPALEFIPERVYQFGLSPEDEATSIAHHIWNQGYRRVAAIAPESTLGQRLNEAFSAQWTELGGTLLRRVEYEGDQSRYSKAVRQAFNLDLSGARSQRLIKTIGRSVIHQPRPRKDIDALFIGGLPVDNRQLVPQLRYFGVANVPMYSSSHTYAGKPDPGNDIDLDGASFGDMPLLLGIDTPSQSYQEFRNNWPALGPQAIRMHAFGMDAYAMTNNAAKMRYQENATYEGATGVLSVKRNGDVLRDLEIAKFVKGQPVVLHQPPL